MCHHVEGSRSGEISDDNEAQLRPNSPYALPHRERTKEHDLPEDHWNRQACGRNYPILATRMRIRDKDKF
jgi:hypothetical protein